MKVRQQQRKSFESIVLIRRTDEKSNLIDCCLFAHIDVPKELEKRAKCWNFVSLMFLCQKKKLVIEVIAQTVLFRGSVFLPREGIGIV